jgi:hypothetical protein
MTVLLSQGREPDNGLHQIIFCRQGQQIDAGVFEGGLQQGLTLLASLFEAPAKGFVRSIYVKLLSSLGVLHDDGADVGQLELAAIP